MTHLKQILTYFFTVFALLTATLPAAYADNKKTAKKETVKKDAAKKDNAKKEPADKKKDDKKKDGAKSENSKKDNAKGGKKQEKEKNNAKKETPKETAKNSKEKKDNKDSKNKKETGKDKKENKQAAQTGGRNQESQKKDGKQKDKKADTAKQEALKKQEAAKKEAERREAARREAARQETVHREAPPAPPPPAAPPQPYDEDGMQALVKQQSETERRQETKALPAPSPKVEFSEPASSQSSSKRTAALSRREADELIGNAMGLLGVSYRFGGSSVSSGFDCSGFMQHIFRKTMQINLPRTSAEQAKMGVAISRSELQPGDMVFFSTSRGRISHVGLYIGNNRFIHAPRTGKSIEITSLGNKYWNSKYVTARRVKRYDSGRFTR